MTARDERVERFCRAFYNEAGVHWDTLSAYDRAAAQRCVAAGLAALADDPAQATLARVWDEGWHAAGEAYMTGLSAALHNDPLPDAGDGPPNPYRAALVPGHDHEGGK